MQKWAPKGIKYNLEGQCCQEQDTVPTSESPRGAECQKLGVNSTGKSLLLVPSPTDANVGLSQRERSCQVSARSVPVCLP